MKDRSDWMLCQDTFHWINKRLGPLKVDQFASRLTHKLATNVSWRPDPMAVTTDTFIMNLEELRAYANPITSLWVCGLNQIPSWGEVCVPTSPAPLSTIPVPSTLVPPVQALLVVGMSVPVPSPLGSMGQLAVWVLSSSATRTARFRKKLLLASWRHKSSKAYIFALWQAGAVNGTMIPFHAL